MTENTVGELRDGKMFAPCSKCGETREVCCDSGYYYDQGKTYHESPVCEECCGPHPKLYDGLGGQERGE